MFGGADCARGLVVYLVDDAPLEHMTRLPRLLHAEEYLDEPWHDDAVLKGSLADIAFVNRWLGGRRALIRGVEEVAGAGPLTILDAGTGSGDLPRAIVAWARRRGIRVRVVASDIHDQTLAIARRQSRAYPEIEFLRADVRHLPLPDSSVDLALLSMTLHHLDEDDAVMALRELGRVARRGVLVGELERSWPGYLGARILAATLWRSNRLTRHDGPISVQRAFTPAELHHLACSAGLASPKVRRHPLFRLVLVAAPPR